MIGEFTFSPALVLAMWASGISGGAAAVASWRLVGPGFSWLAAGVVLLVGGPAFLAEPGVGTGLGVLGGVVALVLARRPVPAALAFAAGSLGFLTAAAQSGGILLAVTGAVALGGVTDEMLLGHWYLVDPRLPRWALQRLDAAGAGGLVVDAAVLAVAGALAWSSGEAAVGWAWVALGGMSILLMVGVWFSLKEPSYTGVMAATGLSYLAVLTSLGAVVVGRSLLGEGASLLSLGRLPGL